jgi:hypothetical protein
MLLFRSKNPLVYPGDRLPGVDYSHPAAGSRLVISAVSGTTAGAFYRIDRAVACTFTNSPTSKIDAAIGPSFFGVNQGTAATTLAATAGNINTCTTAYIIRWGGTDGTNNQIIGTTAGNTQADTDGQPGSNFGTGTVVEGGVIIPTGDPCFLVRSGNAPISKQNWLVCNLRTGKISQNTAATSGTGSSSGSTAIIGTSGSHLNGFAGSIAAVMCSNAFLSPAQLLQWAQDPWSFWYPPAVENLIGAGLATPTTIAPPAFPVTYQRNQRIIMSG